MTGPSAESTWTAAELLADLDGPPAPRWPPCSGISTTPRSRHRPASDRLRAALAATLPDGARLVFSMGCHSGLAVSDAASVAVTSADDLAAAMTARGAAYVAATGYGYGDQVSIGLHERLMTLFAAELDGSVSLGDALRNAKQAYFASQASTAHTTRRRCRARSSTASRCSPSAVSALCGRRLPIRPPPRFRTRAGLSSLAYDESFVFTSQTGATGLVRGRAGDGRSFPQVTAGRPVQPRSATDVTAAAGDGSLLPRTAPS